jgi:phosphoenolpyruvate synthase/pyruvate phosphate dikinase
VAERLVVHLGELGRAEMPRAGGKAAGLGELVRAGLPVPAGFWVMTSAYPRWIAEEIENCLVTVDGDHGVVLLGK